MKTSRKTFGRCLLPKWALFKRGRESTEYDGRSGRPKDDTADENVKVVHTMVMCVRRRDLRSTASEMAYILGPNKQS